MSPLELRKTGGTGLMAERRGRETRKRLRTVTNPSPGAIASGVEGGRFRPLDHNSMGEIDRAAREILLEVGLASATRKTASLLLSKGCSQSNDGRIHFPELLVDRALEAVAKDLVLHGRIPGHELALSGRLVHVGSGGAAPFVLDLETGLYRESTLCDLYDMARLVDTLDNIHFFSRSVVARDMESAELLDINTAWACLSGTSKHVCTSVSKPEHLPAIAEICFAIAGSAEAFIERPFLSLNINHVAPPLRFAEGACDVLIDAARLGIPVHVNSFDLLGASSPVTVAGSLVQVVAETLAGIVLAWSANPDAKVVFGLRPMVTDLRTGAMSGGGGEQALLMAASAQMGRYYGLPNSTIAGATDNKVADAQSGYEKSLSVTLAAQAGSNMITQACGMQASLMGCAFESYVIDNEMLGAVLRSLGEIEVSEDTLSQRMIADVARGEGHYLGHEETYRRMSTDFLYPALADRRSHEEWERDGARDIRDRARERTREIFLSHSPVALPEHADRQIRQKFDIRLP